MIFFVQLVLNFSDSVLALMTQQAAQEHALIIKTAMGVISKMRLFTTPLVAVGTTTQAQMVDAEAVWDDYDPGGSTIAVINGPFNLTGGGSFIEFSLPFGTVSIPDTPPVINGGWVETSTALVIFAWNFVSPITLAAPEDGFVVQVKIATGLPV